MEAHPSALAGADVRRWKRWPCPCGHESRRFFVVCPHCQGLPWATAGNGSAPGRGGSLILHAGTQLETHGRAPFYRQHRFSIPSGFLGVLSRRLFGHGEWLGVDGAEWQLDRIGPWAQAWVLREGANAMAAADTTGPWREWLRGSWRVWQKDRIYQLARAGIARHHFVLAIEDGPEVLRIHGGVIDPLRQVEILGDVPLGTVVLSAFLACGLRQQEAE